MNTVTNQDANVKSFNTYIKSHSEAPDLEVELTAPSFDDAVEIVYQDLAPYGWDKKTIRENTMEVA